MEGVGNFQEMSSSLSTPANLSSELSPAEPTQLQQSPNAPNMESKAGNSRYFDSEEHMKFRKEVLSRLNKKLSLFREKMLASHEAPTVGITSATGVSNPPCKCANQHAMIISQLRRVLRMVEIQGDLRKILVHGLEPEDTSVATEEIEHTSLLRKLLKRVIAKYKLLEGSNSKSVIENLQAINKLKEKGFTVEHSLFQSLHNLKISKESEPCTSEINRLLEKCHL